MAPKPNAMSGRKTSSAKKRQAPEPQVVSPDPVTPTPTTRNTANSRRIAEENKEPSPPPEPTAGRTIQFVAHKYFKDHDDTPGSPGRPVGRAKPGIEYPFTNHIFRGDLTKGKMANLAEQYLTEDAKQDVYFEEVRTLVMVPGSKNFKTHVKVDKPSDYELLLQALYECPKATIYVRLEWTAPPSHGGDTAAAADAPYKKKRGNTSSSEDAISERPSGKESLDKQKDIMGDLYANWGLCDACKPIKAKDALCWKNHRTGQTYHLTMWDVANWANAIRAETATLYAPSQAVLSKVHDATPAARGIHAARHAAALAAGDGAQQPSTSSMGAVATTQSSHVAIDLTESTPPPTARTPFADASSAANATFPNAVQAGRVLGPAWPIIEWARKLGDHHVALATKLFDHGIDSMRALAYTMDKGRMADLQLPGHQQSILELWVEDWQHEKESFEDYEKRKAMSAVASSPTGEPSSA